MFPNPMRFSCCLCQGFNIPSEGMWFWFEGMVDLFFYIDLVLNFFTAFEVRVAAAVHHVCPLTWGNMAVLDCSCGSWRTQCFELLFLHQLGGIFFHSNSFEVSATAA